MSLQRMCACKGSYGSCKGSVLAGAAAGCVLARAPGEAVEEMCLQGLLWELQRECACKGSGRTCSCKGSWWSCRRDVLARVPMGAGEGVCLRGLPEAPGGAGAGEQEL